MERQLERRGLIFVRLDPKYSTSEADAGWAVRSNGIGVDGSDVPRFCTPVARRAVRELGWSSCGTRRAPRDPTHTPVRSVAPSLLVSLPHRQCQKGSTKGPPIFGHPVCWLSSSVVSCNPRCLGVPCQMRPSACHMCSEVPEDLRVRTENLRGGGLVF